MKNRDLIYIYNYLYMILVGNNRLKRFFFRLRMSKESAKFIKERIPSVKCPNYYDVVNYNRKLTETLSRYPNREDQTLLIKRLWMLWNLHSKSHSTNIEYYYKYLVFDKSLQRNFYYSGLCLLNNMIGDLIDSTEVTRDVNELLSAKNHDVKVKTGKDYSAFWVKDVDPNHKTLRLQYLSELITDVKYLLNYNQNDK